MIKIQGYISWQNIADELYIIDGRNQNTYVLKDDVSKQIWNDLVSNVSMEEIIDAIVKKYGIARQVATSDCEEFLNGMQECEIIEKNE